MPELANRDEFERLLASRLARVNGQHRRELIELLGDPPDIGRIDAAFWTRASAELQAVIAPILEDVAIAAAEQLIAGLPIGVDWGLVNQQAADWAARYTFDLVRGLNDTTQRALSRAITRFYEQKQTMEQLRESIARILSPARAEAIAITEVTRATTEGRRQSVEDLRRQGIEMIEVWLTRNDELVCPICGPLHEKPRGEWGAVSGPPAHVRCRCDVVHELPPIPEGAI